MYCNECGAPLGVAANVCSKCGKPMVAGVAVAAAPATMPAVSMLVRQRQILGTFWLIYAVYELVRGILVIGAGSFLPIMARQWSPNFPAFLGPLLGFVGGVMLLIATAGIVTGYGLLQRAPWARVLAIVMAIVSLLSVPFGTALGIWTLVVMLSGTAEADWRRLSATGA